MLVILTCKLREGLKCNRRVITACRTAIAPVAAIPVAIARPLLLLWLGALDGWRSNTMECCRVLSQMIRMNDHVLQALVDRSDHMLHRAVQ